MSDETTLQAIEAFEAADEEQIVAELRGDVLEKFCYEFPGTDGKTQRGISWAGIKEIKYQKLNVTLDVVSVERYDDEWAAVVKATMVGETPISAIGGAAQPRQMKTRNGLVADKFALPKALSKAQRNAIVALLSETQKASFVEAWMKETGRVARLTAPKKAESPAPAKKAAPVKKLDKAKAVLAKPKAEPEVQEQAAEPANGVYTALPEGAIDPARLPEEWQPVYGHIYGLVQGRKLQVAWARSLLRANYPDKLPYVLAGLASTGHPLPENGK